jgi:hypothetical protein
MLKIYFGDLENSIYNTSMYFDNTYETKWFKDNLAKEIIKDIDKSDVADNGFVISPIFGVIPCERISGGAKTLLLIRNEKDKIFNASTCGDNCAKWILRIAEENREIDTIINLRHIMDFGNLEFNIEILNNHKIVHNMKELLPLACEFVH